MLHERVGPVVHNVSGDGRCLGHARQRGVPSRQRTRLSSLSTSLNSIGPTRRAAPGRPGRTMLRLRRRQQAWGRARRRQRFAATPPLRAIDDACGVAGPQTPPPLVHRPLQHVELLADRLHAHSPATSRPRRIVDRRFERFFHSTTGIREHTPFHPKSVCAGSMGHRCARSRDQVLRAGRRGRPSPPGCRMCYALKSR